MPTSEARIAPNRDSCLRLIRALRVETHETWLKDGRYLNMALLAEQEKELLKLAAQTTTATTGSIDYLITAFSQLDAHNHRPQPAGQWRRPSFR